MANLADLEDAPAAPNDNETPKAPEGGETPKPVGDDESKLFDGIPEDHPIRKYIPKLRNENASRRQQVHERDEAISELQGKLKDAKTPDDFNALIEAHNKVVAEKDLALARKDVAREFGLPPKVESALSGGDLEALRTEAKEWQELFGNRTPAPLPPSGGRSPSEPKSDVASAVAAIRAQRQ